jgi:hypothetical protein
VPRPRWIASSVVVALAGAGVGASLVGVSSAASGPARVANSATAPPIPPATLTATRITQQPHTLKPGTTVSASSLGQRVFVDRRHGFALAATDEADYPAETTNGGVTWKTFGPVLHEDAAQGPLVVTEVGALNRRTIYFYGASQSVDVTNDGGKQWWRTFSEELSLAVVPGDTGRLVWITQEGYGSGNNAVTWPYESTDGGKIWHYTTQLGGGF